MILAFIGGVISSVVAHQVWGFEVNQWQYWAISLFIISMTTILDFIGK